MEKKTTKSEPTSNKKITAPVNKAQTRSQPFPIFIVWQSILLILLVVALGGVGYTIKQMRHITQQQSTQQSSDNQQITAIQNTQRNIQKALSGLDKRLVTQQQQIDQVNKRIENFLLEKARKGKDWVLNEIDNYLRLAQLSLRYNRNINAALTLLQTADERLIALSNPAFNALRQRIADDITALKAISKVDTTGLLATLAALTQQIEQLPLPHTNSLLRKAKSSQPEIESQSTWKQGLQHSWQSLQKMIVIRRTDQPITPMLLPQQRNILEQNLQLLLQQAQWAVLQAEPSLYQQSLEQASNWIKRYFDQDAANTRSVLTTLAKLKAVDIKPKLPNLSSSIRPLESLIKPTALQEK